MYLIIILCYNNLTKFLKNMKKILYIITSLTMFEVAEAQTVRDLNDHLKYLEAREMILSKNLANIDTPGYEPKDLQKSNQSYTGTSLSTTHPGHIQTDQSLEYNIIAGDIIEIKPNGNAVTAEHELAKKNENGLRFSQTGNIIAAVNKMTSNAMQ